MSEVYTEAATSESFLFSKFNAQGQMVARTLNAKNTGIELDRSYIEEQILQIKRVRLSVLVDPVLEALDNRDIILLYTTKAKMPQAFPFIISKWDDKVRAVIFVNNFGTISKTPDGSEYLNITMKDLYALMECAYIGLRYSERPDLITKKNGLMKTATEIYTMMMLNLLNKTKALSMDPSAYDKVSYCVAKFFLERVWMSKNEEVNASYALGVNNNARGRNILEINVLNDDYDAAHIQNIHDLIKFLGEVTPRLADMNITFFCDSFIRMYKAPAVMGLEVLPYFFFTVNSSLIGSFIVRAEMITDICKRVNGMNKFYAELARAVA